jgi:hypothetical protein
MVLFSLKQTSAVFAYIGAWVSHSLEYANICELSAALGPVGCIKANTVRQLILVSGFMKPSRWGSEWCTAVWNVTSYACETVASLQRQLGTTSQQSPQEPLAPLWVAQH